MFVDRNQDGRVYGRWTVRQWGGQEELPDDHPDLNPPPTAEQSAATISAGLMRARQMRETILNRLTGIAGRYQRAGDVVAASACDAAAAALLDITKSPAVLAATSELALKGAILTEYRNIAGGLAVSAPYAVAAFEGYEA